MIAWFVLTLAAGVDHGFGPLPATPLPDISVTTELGQTMPLRELLKDRPAAIQFIFTDCTTACPLLGSLFRSVEKRLEEPGRALLLSVSVNPARDDAPRLKTWLDQFRRTDKWRAVHVSEPALKKLLGAFQQQSGPATSHSTQVFFVKPGGEVMGRTTGLPDAAGVAAILRKIE